MTSWVSLQHKWFFYLVKYLKVARNMYTHCRTRMVTQHLCFFSSPTIQNKLFWLFLRHRAQRGLKNRLQKVNFFELLKIIMASVLPVILPAQRISPWIKKPKMLCKSTIMATIMKHSQIVKECNRNYLKLITLQG